MDPDSCRRLNRQGRKVFLDRYIQWVLEVDNATWSSQQAVLVNAYVRNARNFMMSREEYLRMKGELRGRSKIALQK